MKLRRILITLLIAIPILIIGYIAIWAWNTARTPMLELIPPQQANTQQETARYNGKFKRTSLFHGQISGGGSEVGCVYESSDGIKVWSSSGNYGSPSGAAKALQAALKHATQIIERVSRLDDTGRRIGERVIARLTIPPDTTERVSILQTTGSSFSEMYSSSLEDLLELERNPPP